MSLKYPADWKFRGVGSPVPPDAIEAFKDLLVDIADRSKTTLEEFKGVAMGWDKVARLGRLGPAG